MSPDQPKQPKTAPPTTISKPRRRGETARELFSTIAVIVTALLVAFGLLTYVFQSYEVDGPSMQNTLHNQDRLIVWKTARTWSRITHHQYVPNRGDIMIFSESGLSAYGQEDSKQLIKRVVGVPGDHVVVQNGEITIYNHAHPKGFKPDKTLPYAHETTIPYTSGNIDVTLDKNELFMCGDNRGNSLDSRIFGPIETNQVIGKLVLRIYPFSDTQKF